MKYAVRYYKFEKQLEGNIQWMFVVGCGMYTNIDPTPRLARRSIQLVVRDTLTKNKNKRGQDVIRHARNLFGWNGWTSSVRKDINIYRKAGGGFGSSIEEEIREYCMVCSYCIESYLLTIV